VPWVEAALTCGDGPLVFVLAGRCTSPLSRSQTLTHSQPRKAGQDVRASSLTLKPRDESGTQGRCDRSAQATDGSLECRVHELPADHTDPFPVPAFVDHGRPLVVLYGRRYAGPAEPIRPPGRQVRRCPTERRGGVYAGQLRGLTASDLVRSEFGERDRCGGSACIRS
jgi:hypothetical protein